MIYPTQPTSNLVVRMLKSYGDDLRKWLSGIGTRYAMGIGLMACGAVLLTVAAGIGTAAAFHYIETRYGAYVAYAVVGGACFVLGTVGLLAGRATLGQPAAPLPSPQRQAQILKQSIAAPATALLFPSNRRQSSRVDPVTQILAVGAATVLLGWVTATHLHRHERSDRK